MSISTYDELKSAVATWLNRSDLTDQIPDFIALAESRLNRRLRLRNQYDEANLSTAIGSNTVALPADFSEGICFWDAITPDRTLLKQVLPSEVIVTTIQGEPEYYWIDDAIYFERPCDQVYALVLRYIKKFALSDANPTNWLLTNHPDVYLFAALEEAGPYLRDDNLLAIYAQRAQRAMDEVLAHDSKNRQVTLVTDIPLPRRRWDWRRGY